MVIGSAGKGNLIRFNTKRGIRFGTCTRTFEVAYNTISDNNYSGIAVDSNNDGIDACDVTISGKLDTLIDLMSKQSQPAKQTSTPVVAAAKKEVVPNIELKAAVKKAVKVAKAAPAAKTPAKKVVAKKVAKTAKKK
jgi:hypothetical protein